MTYKPKRVAAPRLIFDAASALAGQVEASSQIDDANRDRWYNAIAKATGQLMDGTRYEITGDEANRDRWYNALTKATGQLMDGVRYEITGDEMVFPSRTRSGLSHRVNGVCDCEAGEQGDPCWHRAAKRMIAMIAEVEQVTVVTPPDAPPQCGRCGSEMFERAGRLICPNCQHSRQAPIAPRGALWAPRPAISAEQAMREIDELYA